MFFFPKIVLVLVGLVELGAASPLKPDTVTVTDVTTVTVTRFSTVGAATSSKQLTYAAFRASSSSLTAETSIASTGLSTASVGSSSVSTKELSTALASSSSSTEASSPSSTEASPSSSTLGTSANAKTKSAPHSTGSTKSAGALPVGNTVQAPQPQDAVPDDAAIYSPGGSSIDMTAFFNWRQSIRNDHEKNGKYASRWIKVQPGNYELAFTDKNHNNIDVTFWTGEWTLDLRGVTVTNRYDSAHPDSPNPLFYVNQAGPTFTILGGTFWQDVGEIWSQGKVESVVADASQGFDMSVVTLTVDEGYDLGAWSKGGIKAASSRTPPPIECMDVSNTDHFTRPDCNFWYMKMDSLKVFGRTVTFAITSRGGIKAGLYLAIPTGASMGATLVNEDMDGLTVKGLTTNGAFTYIGHITTGPPVYENTYIVNGPLPPGQSPRINGPTMSEGHIGLFELCEFPPCETYPGSKWQYTGNVKDLMALEVAPALPKPGM